MLDKPLRVAYSSKHKPLSRLKQMKTTKTKATHKGECQFCEKIQKLPNGKLAKHGYKVIDSAFADTCLGSELLPYNQSCKEIETQLIPQVQAIIVRLQSLVERVKEETDFCHKKVYYPEYRCDSWTRGQIRERVNTGDTVWTGKHFEFLHNNKFEPVPMYVLLELETNTVISVASYYNAKYIKHLQTQISECEQALARLQNRVTNWEEKELIAI